MLRALADDPVGRRRLLDVKQLDLRRREPPLYRLRVGNWRVVYFVSADVISVVRIFHRVEGYGWLETFHF